MHQLKPVIKTFDVVHDERYEKEAQYLVRRFQEHIYKLDPVRPHLVVVLKGDGGIASEGKKQIEKNNPNAIILGVKKPRKEGIPYSRATIAEVKRLDEIDKYITKIDQGRYEIVEHKAVDLFIDGGLCGTAFNEVAVCRDKSPNQALKFYLYWIPKPEDSSPIKKTKLFTRYFTDGLIVGDGTVIGNPLGRGGYQKTAGVPRYKDEESMGVGIIAPSVEKKDILGRILELFGREVLPKGFVAPENSVIEFELVIRKGSIFVDYDPVADVSPDGLKKFQVKKSKQKIKFIKFQSSSLLRLYDYVGRLHPRIRR